MEIADIFVINKADREGAERVEREVKAMQSLSMRVTTGCPRGQDVATSARRGELASAIDDYEAFLSISERGRQRRIANWRARLREMWPTRCCGASCNEHSPTTP